MRSFRSNFDIRVCGGNGLFKIRMRIFYEGFFVRFGVFLAFGFSKTEVDDVGVEVRGC